MKLHIRVLLVCLVAFTELAIFISGHIYRPFHSRLALSVRKGISPGNLKASEFFQLTSTSGIIAPDTPTLAPSVVEDSLPRKNKK